jgi:hypothetical protein
MSSPEATSPKVQPLGVPTDVIARRFAVTTTTVFRWSAEGVIPPPTFRGPRRCLWDLEAVEAALRARAAARQKGGVNAAAV